MKTFLSFVGLLLVIGLLFLIAGPPARAQSIEPLTGGMKTFSMGSCGTSRTSASSTTISSAAAGTAFSGYTPGCPVNLALTTTAFTGTCYLEESLDGTGTNWWSAQVGAAGAVIGLGQWTFSADTSKTFSPIVETRANVPMRLDCGVLSGSYSSGSVVATFYP